MRRNRAAMRNAAGHAGITVVACLLGCSDRNAAPSTADASGEESSGTTTTSASDTSTGGSDTGEEEPTYAVVVLRGVGDGTLLPAIEYPLALSPNYNTAVVRRSGEPDLLAVAYRMGQGQTLEDGLCVYAIDGDLEQIECHILPERQVSMEGADLDGNGADEIVYTMLTSEVGLVRVGSGNPPETFTFEGPDDVLERFRSLEVADVDGDARVDIVMAAEEGPQDGVIADWVVRASLGPSGLEASLLPDLPSSDVSVLADLTGDGITDLLLDELSPAHKRIYAGDGTTFAGPVLEFPYEYWFVEVFATDLDGDGQTDLGYARQVAESPDCLGTHVIDWRRGPFLGELPPVQTLEGTEFREGDRLPTIVDLDGDGVAELVSPVRGACPPAEGTSIRRLVPSAQVETGPALCDDCTLASESQAMDVDGDGHLDIIAIIER